LVKKIKKISAISVICGQLFGCGRSSRTTRSSVLCWVAGSSGLGVIMTIRVILADDHRMLRQVLGRALAAEEDIEFVGQAGDGREAIAMAKELEPDILVMDINMPRLNGIEAARRILSSVPQTRIIILSMFSEQEQVIHALRAGVLGYVLKNAAVEELLLAIHAVNDGHLYLSPAVLRPIVDGYLEWMETQGPLPLDCLTLREREVLKLIAEGKSNQEIGQELRLGLRTAESHRANLMKKLNLHNMAQVVRFAIRQGVIRSAG